MNIPWKLKSSIFRLIDLLDATKALYFLQKYANVSKDWDYANIAYLGVT